MDFGSKNIFSSLLFHNAIILAMWSVSDYIARHDFRMFTFFISRNVILFAIILRDEVNSIALAFIITNDVWPGLVSALTEEEVKLTSHQNYLAVEFSFTSPNKQ